VWSYNSTPSIHLMVWCLIKQDIYINMAWYLVKYRDNFTFALQYSTHRHIIFQHTSPTSQHKLLYIFRKNVSSQSGKPHMHHLLQIVLLLKQWSLKAFFQGQTCNKSLIGQSQGCMVRCSRMSNADVGVSV